MITRFCSRCGDASQDVLTWTSAAWRNANGVRVAQKHSLCLTCVATRLAPLKVACESPEMTCPGCGISTADDWDAVYVTMVPRGVGKVRADAPFCGVCAAHFRIWFLEGQPTVLQERTVDRDELEDAVDARLRATWGALGLIPVQE